MIAAVTQLEAQGREGSEWGSRERKRSQAKFRYHHHCHHHRHHRHRHPAERQSRINRTKGGFSARLPSDPST